MAHQSYKLTQVLFTSFCIQFLCGWTVGEAPVDSLASIGTLSSCTESVIKDLSGYYSKKDAPTECHRWGLKWIAHKGADHKMTALTVGNEAWIDIMREADPNYTNTSADGPRRLPTIKELVRIFEYDINPLTKSTAGVPVGDHVFRAWLQASDKGNAPLTGYLISSTYRHINSTSGNNGEMNGSRKRIRYLGIEIGTGKVVAFNGSLKLCQSLDSSASCNKPATDVSVYAFFVEPL